VALGAQHLLAQRLKEEDVVVESRQAVGHGGTLGALIDRELDHLRVLQLVADVHEVVENRDAQPRIALQRHAHRVAVRDHPLPVARGLALGEVEVREQVEQRRVERVAVALLALELLEQGFLAARPRFEELEQRLSEIE
jgi:hypothetical protein